MIVDHRLNVILAAGSLGVASFPLVAAAKACGGGFSNRVWWSDLDDSGQLVQRNIEPVRPQIPNESPDLVRFKADSDS